MSLPNVFKALSDPVRRDILMLLKSRGQLSAGDIASEFELSNATIIYHINNTSVLCAFVMSLFIILTNVTYASISIEGTNSALLHLAFPLK